MPLFELFRAAKGKPSASNEKPTSTSADPSPPHENELVELIWENGQVMMQGQSSRARKNPSPYNTYNLPPYSLPSHSPERGKDLSCAPHSSSSVKVRTSDSGLNEFPTSVPLGEMCLSSDDDIVPWFDYPIDESLRNDYCSDFLSELSGVTAKEPSQNDFDTMKRDGCINHVYRDSNENSIYNGLNLDHRNTAKSSSPAVVSEAMRHETCRGPAEQSQFPSLRPRHVSENTGTSTSNHCVSRDLSQVTNSAAGFSCEKLRKQNPGPSISRNELQNFAHFSRPAVFCKSAVGKKIDDSGPSSSERAHFKLKDSSPDVKIVQSNSGQIGEMRSHGQFAAEKEVNDSRSLEAKPTEEPPSKESEGNRQERAAKDDKLRNESGGTSMSKEPQDAVEPVVASSICSGNGVDSASDDPASNLKRKGRINYDSEAPSDDVEEDSAGLRKSAPARGSSSKRSRSAEVHNLSERRRRDRINEKMRALQELIPNCNKVDKASMLDEAIDYLKTLQLQVQMMSMGAGLYMPPMMLPAHMAQFSPMGLGMAAGLGFRMGMVEPNGVPTACPMLRVPPMQGAHFPSPVMPGHQTFHGMAGPNFPIISLPSQVLPLSVPYMPPLVPSPGGHPLVPPGFNANVAKGHTENADAAFASSSKEATGNINGASCSMKNHIPGQCQARNSVEQPEDRAVASSTAPRDVTRPSTATNEDKLV